MRRITDHASPFRKEGLLRARAVPRAMVIAFAAIRLPAHERNDSELLVAGLLNLLLIAIVAALPGTAAAHCGPDPDADVHVVITDDARLRSAARSRHRRC